MRLRRRHSSLPDWAPRLIATIIIAVLATLALLYLLFKITDLLSWVLVALFLSFAIEPIVNQLAHRGWNRNAATIFVIASFGGLLILLVAAMIPLIIQQISEIVKQSPDWVTSLISTINNVAGTDISQSEVLSNISATDQFITNYATGLASNVLGFSKQLLQGLLQALAIVLFTFYFVSDGPYLRRVICSFLSSSQQKVVLSTWELAIEKTGGYMFSRLILGTISTIFHFIALTILGVPFAFPLAVWIGSISQFLPIIGTYIAAAIPLLVAVLQSPIDAAVLLVVIIVYQQIENYIIGPKISSQTMELHPAIAFAAVLAGASIGGIIGAFIALPIAAMLQEIAKVYLNRNEVIESRLTQAIPKKKLKQKNTT